MDVDFLFARDGLLARVIERYRPRAGQIAMAEAVARSLAEKRSLLVEGPTGTGKSQAYLGAAAVVLAERPPRESGAIVVATANIALQEQLVGKDLPLLQRALGANWTFGLLKGRGNYLCQQKVEAERKYAKARSGYEPGAEDRERLAEILAWAAKTETGDLVELPFDPRNLASGLWKRFASSSDDCTKPKCPFQRECFATVARARAKGWDFVVTNYHLLFSQAKFVGLNVPTKAALREGTGAVCGTLPRIYGLICDEAHEVPGVARSFAGEELRYKQIRWLASRAKSLGIDASYLYQPAQDFFRDLGEWKLTDARKQRRDREIYFRRSFPVPIQLLEEVLVKFSVEVAGRLGPRFGKPSFLEEQALGDYADADEHRRLLEQVAAELEEEAARRRQARRKQDPAQALYDGTADDRELDRAQFLTACSLARSAKKHLDLLRNAAELGAGRDPIWYPEFPPIEAKARPNPVDCSLKSTLVQAAPFLAGSIWKPVSRVVATSATLAVGGSLGRATEELGLGDEVRPLIVSTPFDLPRQAAIVIPTASVDMPTKPPADEEKHIAAVTESLAWAIRTCEGRTLALFTAWRTLGAVYDRIAAMGFPYKLLRQGEGAQRSDLVRQFKEDEHSVLFGVDSFWKGIDVPGDALRAVVIDKLPFAPPESPLAAALEAYYAARGKNVFYDWQVPEAVIALRQGVGRLIRRTDDYGIVVICDRRLSSQGAGYRSQFWKSMPGWGRCDSLDVGARLLATFAENAAELRAREAGEADDVDGTD